MSLVVIEGCHATTAHHHGIAQVSGDPFVVDQNGAKVQFFLPLREDVLLLKCQSLQLYGRAFASEIAGDHQQWFDRFRIVVDTKEELAVEITKNMTAVHDDADISTNRKDVQSLATLMVTVEG